MDWHIFPFYFLESEKYSEQYYAIHRPTIITQISPLGGSQFCLAFSLAGDPVPPQIESSALNHSSDRLLDLGWPLSKNGSIAGTGERLTSPWMDFAYNCLALSTAFAQRFLTLDSNTAGWIPGLLRTVEVVLNRPNFSGLSCYPSSRGASSQKHFRPASLNLTPPWRLTPFLHHVWCKALPAPFAKLSLPRWWLWLSLEITLATLIPDVKCCF